MKTRTDGHHNTMISSDTRADWSEGFELVPSIQVAYVWHAFVYTREVLNGLERMAFWRFLCHEAGCYKVWTGERSTLFPNKTVKYSELRPTEDVADRV